MLIDMTPAEISHKILTLTYQMIIVIIYNMDKLAKTHYEIARNTHNGDLAIPQPGFKQSTIQKLTSAKLFAGAKELVIAHAGHE